MLDRVLDIIGISYLGLCVTMALAGMYQAFKYQRTGAKLRTGMAALNSKYQISISDLLTPEWESGWIPITSTAKKKIDQILFSKDFEEVPEIRELREKCLRHRRRYYQFAALFNILFFLMLLLIYLAYAFSGNKPSLPR